jgi:putative aldouronate transport system substrate-binding protein
MYVGSDGKLHDARGTAEMRDALKHIHEMYQEGLILQDFTTKGTVTAGNDDFRAGLLEGDRGFASFDYNQTTTIYNDDAKCKVLNDGKFNFSSILPAVADFEGNGTYIHYTESWRSVKTQGWFITSATADNQAVLKRCLDLFDYLYSDVGNRLMSYGPDAYLAKNEDGTIKTMDYQGKQVPVLSDACKSELATLTGGNYTNYYRFYVGATYPVGYVKQQGMEYQTVSKAALPYLNTINQAIAYGVLQHVNHKDDNTDHLYDIVPTTLPFTAAENTTLSDTYTDLEKCINNNKGKTNVYSTIVMKGFGSGADYQNQDFSYENFCTTVKTVLKCDSYTKIYNDAYTRFKAL